MCQCVADFPKKYGEMGHSKIEQDSLEDISERP